MSAKYLEKITVCLQAATPGEWYGTFPDTNGNIKILSRDHSLNPVCYVPGRANAEFIVWSHNDFLPDMLAEVDRLQKENADCKNKLAANERVSVKVISCLKFAQKMLDRLKPEIEEKNLRIAMLESAFEMSCRELATGYCCPIEFNNYECEKCKSCSHNTDTYYHTERDTACWKDYFMQKTQKQEKKNEKNM